MTDVIIIGGGTAGLTAAIYLRRSELRCTVLEGESFGGRILPSLSVDNYPGMPGVSGFDYSEKLRSQAENLGAELAYNTAIALSRNGETWVVGTPDGEMSARAVIFAAGEKPRPLNIQGEADFFGRGVSTCAACDGAFYRGMDVAVIGGGDKAVDDALTLSRLCKNVYLVHRREGFRAAAGSVAKLTQMPNVRLHLNKIPVSVDGAERVEGLTLSGTKGGDLETLTVSGVFVAIGSIPQTALCAGLLPLDEQGYIIADESCATSEPGLFVAGDARRKPLRQLVTAAADGAVAAKAAESYITHMN